MADSRQALLREDRGLFVATAGSDMMDTEAAARDAVSNLSHVLAGRNPTVLLVWDGEPSSTNDSESLMRAITRRFPHQSIYGANGFSAVSPYGVRHRLSLMAIGGRIRYRAADTPCTLSNAASAGAALGTVLSRWIRPNTRDGQLVVILGNCHVPANDTLVNSLQSALPATASLIPIVGAAHPLEGRCYVAGRPIKERALALLLTGAFTVRVSMASGDGTEGIVRSARTAMEQAAGTGVTGVLVFDCAGRMGALAEQRELELQALTAGCKGAPFAGFYSSGEIGAVRAGQPAVGAGQHIVCCALQGR